MYRYGTGCGYNYGGYQVGYGYGNYQQAACSPQAGVGGGNCCLILVLFILLVLLGLCA